MNEHLARDLDRAQRILYATVTFWVCIWVLGIALVFFVPNIAWAVLVLGNMASIGAWMHFSMDNYGELYVTTLRRRIKHDNFMRANR